MGTMVEAVPSTQCIQQVTCTRSTNWATGQLARWRVVQTASEMDGLRNFENAKGTRLSF
jgi:hypothetical protein